MTSATTLRATVRNTAPSVRRPSDASIPTVEGSVCLINVRMIAGATTGRAGRTRLQRWPLLRTMQDPQHVHRVVHFIDCDERKRNENEFASAFDASSTSEVRKRFECRDTFDDCLRNPTCRLGSAFRDVVADPLQIIRRVRRPADAHQP